MRTTHAIDHLHRLLAHAKRDPLAQSALLYLLERADIALWELIKVPFGETITDTATITITAQMVAQEWIPLTGVSSFDQVKAIRASYSGTLSAPSILRRETESMTEQGLATEPRHRFINAGAGNAPRIELYPFPQEGDTLLIEYRRLPRRPSIYRAAIGDLDRSAKEWTVTNGNWPFAANDLVGALFILDDKGGQIECLISENGDRSNPYVDLGSAIYGTGTRSAVPACIDIASELPEQIASLLPAAAYDIATTAHLSDTTVRKVEEALATIPRASEIISERNHQANRFFTGISAGGGWDHYEGREW